MKFLMFVLTFEELQETCSEGLKWMRKIETFPEGYFDDPFHRVIQRQRQIEKLPERFRSVKLHTGFFGGEA